MVVVAVVVAVGVVAVDVDVVVGVGMRTVVEAGMPFAGARLGQVWKIQSENKRNSFLRMINGLQTKKVLRAMKLN